MPMSSASGPTGGIVTQVKDIPHSDGVMVAFKLPAPVGQQLLDMAKSAGVPADCLMPLDEMHVTLAYLGDVNEQTGPDEEALQGELTSFATGWKSIDGTLNGIGRFVNDDTDCIYANFDSPDLPRFRQALVAFLKGADCRVDDTHGYSPHVTLAYIPKDMPTPDIPLQPISVSFNSLWEAYADRGDYIIPLGATKAQVTKVRAQYTDQAKRPAERCALCKHFIKANRCQIVEGTISPQGWCRFYEVKEGVKTVMPYKIVKRKNGKWFVKDGSTGKLTPESGYDTRGQALDYQRVLYAPDASKAVLPEQRVTSVDSGTDDAQKDSAYAYPEGNKLPMPDAGHVVLAAAALGPNPPHGHGADIPKGELSKVKGRIRSRAHALGMGKEDLAKVNAYLSGHMPSEKMAAKEVEAWAGTYEKVLRMTGDDIKAAAAAQGMINRQQLIGSKALDGGLPTTVAGWAMLFTDPDQLDLQGTYFNGLTDTMTEYYPDAPLWMEHGADKRYGSEPIGHRTKCEVYPFGIWMEHALHTDHPLYKKTAQDIRDGKLSYSSDSLAHYAAQGFNPDDGHLGVWPLAGCSLTHTPAEPGLGLVTAKTLEVALKSAAQQREVADGAKGAKTVRTKEDSMTDTIDAAKTDAAKGVDGVDQNDNFDDSPDTSINTSPGSTLQALARMYNVEPEPMHVRKAMDDHIARMMAAGKADPGVVSAMNLPPEVKADDVADHLNNLYSAAMAVPMPPEAEPAHILNYAALSDHLHSGGQAAKAKGPFFTGEMTNINVNRGVQKPGIRAFVADMLRVQAGLTPRNYFQGPNAAKAMNAMKAMTSATGPTGGYILHQEIADVVLDPLRAQAVAFQLGAQEHNMQGTNVLTVPVMNSAPAASWQGENQATTDSQPGYRTVTLYPRGIYSIVKIPFNVEANMTPQAENQLRTQMAKSIALKLDLAAMQGSGGADASGVGTTPIGILNTPGSQQMAFGSNGRIPQFIDIVQAFGLLDDANVPLDASSRRGIAMHTSISRAFTGATDTLGNPLLRRAWAQPSDREITGLPYALSTQISTNVTQGTATNASYIFVGDWQWMYIGLSDQVEVRLDQTFAGNLQAGLLIYMYADIKIVYPQAFVTITGVLPPSIAGTTTSTLTVN